MKKAPLRDRAVHNESLAVGSDGQIARFTRDALEISIEVHDDYIGSKIFRESNFYAWEELDFLAALPIGEGVVVDGGANIGNHSLFFSLILDRKVLAFEPVKDNYEILKRNIERNKTDHQVLAFPIGLSSSPGVLKMVVDRSNMGGSRVVTPDVVEPKNLPNMIGVEVGRIDDLVGAERVALLKLDLEGHEVPALQGATRVLANDRPVVVAESNTLSERVALTALMSKYGYECGTVVGLSDNLVFFHRKAHSRIITSAYAFLARRLERRYKDNATDFPPVIERIFLSEIERLRTVNSRLARAVESSKPSVSQQEPLRKTFGGIRQKWRSWTRR